LVISPGGSRYDIRVLPPDFELSFNNFHTIRSAGLVWRQGDFAGVSLENLVVTAGASMDRSRCHLKAGGSATNRTIVMFRVHYMVGYAFVSISNETWD
jgi:hypothetical protein